MKKFLYKGELSRITLDGKDYCLENGNEYSLPEENQHVKVLIASGILVDADAQKETTLKK